jgi:hypothetical protein
MRGRLLPRSIEKIKALDAGLTRVQNVLRGQFQIFLPSEEEGLQIVYSTFGPTEQTDPLSGRAEREADRFFAWFLVSRLHSRLGKCRRCGRYKVNTQTFYKRGTYCRSCRMRVGAAELTKKKREDRQAKRVLFVRKVLAARSGPFDVASLAQREQLAETANRKLAEEERISSKWIKRNLRSLMSR